MDCPLIQVELVAFHFGSVPDTTRAAVEAHLLACPACLEAFLSLKREIETAAAAPRPSEASRLRLRRAVALEVAARDPMRIERAWRRPLAFGFAAATCAAALVAVLSFRGQLHQLARLAENQDGAERGAPSAPARDE
jgi:anti-sigma factor RsiW